MTVSKNKSERRRREIDELIGVIPANDDAHPPIAATMSPGQLAEFFGTVERTINLLAQRDVLSRLANNRFDTAESTRRYIEFVRRSRGSAELDAEKLRLVSEQADREAIRNATARGDLVEATAVERRWTDILRQVRSALLAVPSRVAGRAGHLTPADLEIIDREIRDALQEMADHDDA